MHLRQAAEESIELCITVLGAAKAGKTALIRRLTDSFQAYDNYKPTQERKLQAPVHKFLIEIEAGIANKQVSVSPRYMEIGSHFLYSHLGVAVVVLYDPASRESFEFAKQCIEKIRAEEHAHSRTRNVPIILVHNLKSEEAERVVSKDEVTQFKQYLENKNYSKIYSIEISTYQPFDLDFFEYHLAMHAGSYEHSLSKVHVEPREIEQEGQRKPQHRDTLLTEQQHQIPLQDFFTKKQRKQKVVRILGFLTLVVLVILIASVTFASGATAVAAAAGAFAVANAVALSCLTLGIGSLLLGRSLKKTLEQPVEVTNDEPPVIKVTFVNKKAYKILGNFLYVCGAIYIGLGLSGLAVTAFPVTSAYLATKIVSGASIASGYLGAAAVIAKNYLTSAGHTVFAFLSNHIIAASPAITGLVVGAGFALLVLTAAIIGIAMKFKKLSHVNEVEMQTLPASVAAASTHSRVAKRSSVNYYADEDTLEDEVEVAYEIHQEKFGVDGTRTSNVLVAMKNQLQWIESKASAAGYKLANGFNDVLSKVRFFQPEQNKSDDFLFDRSKHSGSRSYKRDQF